MVDSRGSSLDVQSVLRSVIQRTLKRRGTVALTLSFDVGCERLYSTLGSCSTMVIIFSWSLVYLL